MKKNKKVENKEKRVFAENWGFAQIFMFFLIGCIIGVYYEQIFNLIKNGVWESRKGIIYGPFNPIYGFGFAGFVFLLGKNVNKRPWYLTYLYSCLIGGISEYSLSLIGEELFNATSWDYSGYFLNIGGRTTIPFMLFWGLGGLIFMKFIYPFICKLISRIPHNFAKIALPIMVVFMCLDMFVSYTALFRQANRLKGHPPITILGEWYDKIYTDEFLKKIYPNMIHDD